MMTTGPNVSSGASAKADGGRQTPMSPEREAARLQWLIAAVFLGLGGWCLVAPASVIDLTVRETYRLHDPFVLLTMSAFGAQAMLAGLFAGLSRFTRATFLGFGLAVLPFFVFDYWFYFVEPVFNSLILLDVAGNLAFLGLCARGYHLLNRTGDTVI
jgi:hypothetical protein